MQTVITMVRQMMRELNETGTEKRKLEVKEDMRKKSVANVVNLERTACRFSSSTCVKCRHKRDPLALFNNGARLTHKLKEMLLL